MKRKLSLEETKVYDFLFYPMFSIFFVIGAKSKSFIMIILPNIYFLICGVYDIMPFSLRKRILCIFSSL